MSAAADRGFPITCLGERFAPNPGRQRGIPPRTSYDESVTVRLSKTIRGVGMGDVIHGRWPSRSGGRTDLLAKHAPGDVGAQGLAANLLTAGQGFALDERAVLSGDPVLKPGLDRLMPLILDVENAGRLNGAAENADRRLGCCLSGGFGFHAEHSTQENLVVLDHLALASGHSHEKLAPMSIHEKIKSLREARKWSQQNLADEIHKREQGKKVLAWQTIQQWENGTSAPTRKRMPFVAAALGVSMQELQGLDASGHAPAAAMQPSEGRLISAYRLIPEDRRAELIEYAMDMVRSSNPDVARLLPPQAPPPMPPESDAAPKTRPPVKKGVMKIGLNLRREPLKPKKSGEA